MVDVVGVLLRPEVRALVVCGSPMLAYPLPEAVVEASGLDCPEGAVPARVAAFSRALRRSVLSRPRVEVDGWGWWPSLVGLVKRAVAAVPADISMHAIITAPPPKSGWLTDRTLWWRDQLAPAEVSLDRCDTDEEWLKTVATWLAELARTELPQGTWPWGHVPKTVRMRRHPRSWICCAALAEALRSPLPWEHVVTREQLLWLWSHECPQQPVRVRIIEQHHYGEVFPPRSAGLLCPLEGSRGSSVR